MVSRYVTNGPVKQDGICLLPPPHFRMIPPQGQRPDGYPVSTPPGTYVQSQQPNQGGNQGPGLRGITPTGPPNQASTPPNAEIKVQAIQQQPLNHMFVQQQVRPTQGAYYRSNGPPNQTQRMPNHNNRPQQALYTPGPTQYVHVPPMYITPNTLPYAAGYPTQRQPGFVQTLPTQMFPHLTAAAPFNHHYSGTPAQSQQVQYNYYQPVMQRTGGSIPQVPPMNPNPPQNPISNVPLVPTNPPHQPFQRQPPKRRPNALSIIDPDTGADRLQEMFEDSSSHPPSGDSSARQTPQPQPHNHNKEVQAAFAKQVMQAINKDVADPSHIEDSDVGSDLVGNHAEPPPPFVVVPSPLPQAAPLSKFEHVVQSSKLQAGAKEFVLSSNTAKETPIVSANCDSIEVTLPNKLPKDRESPVKGARKPREQQQPPQQQPPQQQPPQQQTLLQQQPLPQQQPLQQQPPLQQQQPPLQQQQPPLQQQQPLPQQPREHKDSVKESVPARDEGSSIVKDEVKPAAEPVPIIVPASLPAQVPSAPVKDNQVPEKRAQKKEIKVEPKLASVERIETAPVAISAPVPVQQLPVVSPPSQDNTNAKSKQNAHRSASKQQQQQQPLAQNNNHKQPVAAATPVPTPQPAKAAGGKAHKKNELNQKGANKEGTDMDAFNDNAGNEEVNSNVTQIHLDNDIINANSLPAETTNVVAQPAPESTPDVNVNVPAPVNNKKTDSDEVTANKPAVVEPPKPIKISTSFDITSIVKEIPKDIKPFISKVESQDETDRAAVSTNERLVQVKNDSGSKNDITRLDNKLPYQEGQWSPANQDGLKVYQLEFLRALQNSPASRKPPDNILEAVLADDRGRIGDGGRSSMGGGRSSDFAPSFNNYGKSNSRGAPPKRNSQSKMGPGGKKAPIKVSISVREDVKLHETENAWRPARLIKGENATSEDKKTEELYKKVRGVLNKLTPQKFDTLLAQIKALQIDTSERLQGVIDLCFDKAVDEPNYSVAYALMCRELALMQVPTTTSTEEKPDYVNFRKLLVTRCQVEFEKQSVDESSRNLIVKEIEKSKDPERLKDLQFELEEHDRKLRMKSVGNIRFIGELFKQKMLTVNIMMRCLNILLENRDEESLECLCKLMTTVGKELETSNVALSGIFNTLKNIADHKKDIKVSSRIRFMIQDVIDLRQSKWVPRRQDLNPKTIDQITKEAAHEHMNIQMMNSGPMPRKDDRSNYGGQNNDRKERRGGRNVAEDGGWTTMNTNRNRQQFTVQSEKLKSIAPNTSEPLGNSTMFGNWGKGSVGSNNKGPPSQMATNTTNMYAPLENIEMEKRNINIRIVNKDPYHSKSPSLERNYNKYDGRGSRSGSQHRSNDSSASSSQRSTPAPMLPPPAMTKPVAQPPPAPVEAPKMTEDQILRRITNSLEEYASGNCTVNDYFTEISDIPVSFMPRTVSESYIYVLEKSQQLRLKTGGLFATSLKQNKILLKDYSSGLKEILSQADDLKIDIPKIWDYLAELLVDVVCEEALPLDELCECSLELINQRQAHLLMAPLFKSVIAKKGENFLSSIWKKSDLQLADFVGTEADTFVVDNQFEFLTGASTPTSKKLSTFEEMKDELCNVLESNKDVNSIKEWISSNIGEGVKENMFVRALATAIFTLSIDDKSKLIINRLTHFLSLFHVYVDNENNREMQCLYALQTLIHKMEHPQGLLFQICNNLYELGFISEESFVAWEMDKDPAEQEGKGVALKQLTSFFTQLKENYDEFSGSGAED